MDKGTGTIRLRNMKKTTIIIALLCAGIAGKAQTTETSQVTEKADSIMTKTDSTMAKINALEAIAGGVKNGYLLIENGVVKGCKSIETGTVTGFTKVNDAITLKLFGKDGETIEETKARLDANVEAAEARSKEIVEKNIKATEERVKNARRK